MYLTSAQLIDFRNSAKYEADVKALNGKIAELSKARDLAFKEVAQLKLTLQVTTETRDELRTNLGATQASGDKRAARGLSARARRDEAHTERG